MTDLLRVTGLTKHFDVGEAGVFKRGRGVLRAVDQVDFTVSQGETLGLVGESGCGKSTVGRMLLRLIEPTAGKVEFEGVDLVTLDAKGMRERRRQMQIIFQDPYGALNPRMTVADIIAEPLEIHGVGTAAEARARVFDLLSRVGLAPEHARRYPHEFSGGQRQRIGIARALILRPKLVICDEPVSALDVSIRAQIINLLLELKETLGLSYIMISHDLGVVEHMSDRVAVMYLGKIVETGDWRSIFEKPGHPYTRGLIAAIPDAFAPADVTANKVHGEIPSPFNPPSGCTFHPRCPIMTDQCRVPPGPALRPLTESHEVSCLLA
jgi:oligopeptide/dipeptide ABC transporter ATP-binding protein